jgi:hypothetical protein
MAQERLDFLFAHLLRVTFSAKKPNITDNPVAIGLFGAIGVMMVAQHLPDLIHEFQIWIRAEF